MSQGLHLLIAYSKKLEKARCKKIALSHQGLILLTRVLEPEPEPEPEPLEPRVFSWSRSRSRSRTFFPSAPAPADLWPFTWPFIFLLTTQVFFIQLIDKNELEIFKYSGLKNIQLINSNNQTVTQSNVLYINDEIQGDGSFETVSAYFLPHLRKFK